MGLLKMWPPVSIASNPVVRWLRVPSGQVVAAALSVAVVMLVSTMHSMRQDHTRTVADVERDTRNVSKLLAEHSAQTFDGMAETLRAVGRLRRDVARGIYRSQSSIHVHLKTLQGGSPILSELGWFDRYGERVASSWAFDPPQTSVAERTLFRVARDGVGGRLYVSVPRSLPDMAPDMANDRLWISVSQRVENLDGSFAGVAIGTIDPAAFYRLFDSVELGPGYSISLLRRDGIVLAHAPDETAVGRNWSEVERQQVHPQVGAGGTRRTEAGLDDGAHIASLAVVPRMDGQLLVSVRIATTLALATYRQALATKVLQTMFGLAVLVIGTWLLVLNLRRREELQAALAAAAEIAKAARGEAEAANRAKSEFLARMSHELRTPLNAVIGFGQILALDRANPVSAKQREYCGHVVESGQHLLELINEILDFASVDAGRVNLSVEPLDCGEIVRKVGNMMLPAALQADVDLIVDDAVDTPEVRADPLRLRQILLNLLANGIKYNARGGRVTLTVERCGQDRVRFVVSDTGIGIPTARQAAMFEPFERLGAEQTAVEGTGLGLVVAKRLVEAMGGEIGFASDAGKGSTFWFVLPSVSAEAMEAAA